ncbi:MAG TPA: response regulator [Candidatus Limnocylindrales bacterium]|nr:response regulator [Candidatus Limnocylindrales bacterium]
MTSSTDTAFAPDISSSPRVLGSLGQGKQFENPPVIIMITSDDSPPSWLMAKKAGADAFVVKAEDFHIQLKARIQELFSLAANPMCQRKNQRKSL